MKRVVVLCATLAMFLSSCSMQQIQINDLAIVTAVGIDLNEENGNVLLSAQIIRPADARGQTGAPSGGTGEPIYTISAEGKTLFSTIRNLARMSSRRVYWAHNFLIVMNEKYAKKGIRDMIDFFTRNNELRMNTWVAVTPDQASELVSTITGLEVVPGEAIDKLFRYSKIVAESPRTNMMRLQEAYLNPTSHPVLAKLQLQNRGISNKKPQAYGSLNQVELSGTAVFKEDKMVGWLTPEQSRSLLMFISKIESAVTVIPCRDLEDQQVTLEIMEQTLQVTPTYKHERPGFHLAIQAQAKMVESGCQESYEEMRPYLTDELEKSIQAQTQSLLKASQQQYGADFLKLGEVFHNRYPSEWKTVGDQWDDLYPEAEMKLEVQADLSSSVLKLNGLTK